MKYFTGLLLVSFIFFSFLPYLCMGPCAASDLQPYSLGLALLMLALGKFSMPRTLKPLYWFALLTSCIALWRTNSTLELRTAFGSISLFLYAGIFLYVGRHHRRTLRDGAVMALFLWFFFGLLELLTFKDLLVPILGNMRTDPTRSVTSLGPEPSQFGIMLILCGILCSLFLKGRRASVLVIASFLAAFVLSKSAVVIGVGTLILLVCYFRWRHVLPMLGISLSVVGCFVSLNRQGASNNRIGTLINSALSDPLSILVGDASVNDRIGNIFGSLASFYESGGMPFYFESWKGFVESYIFGFKIFQENAFFTKDFILSTLGNMLFSTGTLGLLLILYIGILVALVNQQHRRDSLRILLALLIGLTLLPLSLNTPVLGAILGVSLEKLERGRHATN